MPKENSTPNSPSESHTNISDDLLANTLPPRTGPYRSLSAKRPRDPSHRKSVSFNDVPIVHEVPSHDAMRNSNCDAYRSWTYTDATTPTSVIPSFYSSQILSPFNSTNPIAQKPNINRLNNTLNATPTTPPAPAPAPPPTTTTTTTTVTNRIPDWAMRPRTAKSALSTEETHPTNENHSIWNPPLIIVHTPDERTTNKETSVKNSNNPYTVHPQQPTSSLSINSENPEEKKHPYRSAMIPDNDHYRNLPFNLGPMSDSTATYTSMISTNIIQSPHHHHHNEHPTIGAYSRAARARSATLPMSVMHSSGRSNDTVSITPFRPPTALLPNGSSTSTRAVLRPTTIAFQCSQPTATTISTINGTPTVISTSTNNNHNTNVTNLSSTKSSNVPPRFGAATPGAHARYVSPQHRTFSTTTLGSSAIKYAYAHPTMDSTLTNTITPHGTAAKPPSTAYPRSRSANVLSSRRTVASPVVMLDGQSQKGTTTTTTTTITPTTSLYATTKRNPNVRQTYGSYYMHRVLLPTTIN